ncbi:glycosyltransferase family 1 protein [Roseomonas sp. AR75]|uniref:glycosyltransferase family 4 protein n=1 Tax=Roseomonas sp. AR75 TaxID=2562311 RepID=UPI0010C125AB|nr:glycosyltransferase family 1 protein [Roseomonas sp. AR75]
MTPPARIVLDVSSILRWTGPPVGILRVEQELARHGLAAEPDVVPAFFDPRRGVFRALNPAWRDRLLGAEAAIDHVTLDWRRQRRLWQNLASPRYPAAMALERLRLAGHGWAAQAQRRLLGAYVHHAPFGAPGVRHAVVPLDMALGATLALGPRDRLLLAGSGWARARAAAAHGMEAGARLVPLCYDLIPLLHPEWFPPEELPDFEAYWAALLPAAARVLCNAACVAEDITRHAATLGHRIAPPSVLPLGFAPPPPVPPAPLPPPLSPGRFALFVSTIEPRKGHAALLAAWRRLVAEGVPQRADFRLVFVGRPGWMVEAVLRALPDADGALGGRVLHLRHVDDATLRRLLADCAFTLYPSRYEGFGLPIIESFAAGKAVIASTGGAVPETVGGLSPCLDPLDVDAWTATLGAWIADPAARAPWEARIARQFRPLHWPEAAAGIFAATRAA